MDMKLNQTNKPAKHFNHKSAISNQKFKRFYADRVAVVVAIIAVLISLLLPALAQVKFAAKQNELRTEFAAYRGDADVLCK
jgi:hypothetical protein